jgi:hypothetical protein
MRNAIAVVVTSIRAPTSALRSLAQGCQQRGYPLIVVGDEATPSQFYLDGCAFYSLQEQRKLSSRLAQLCPTGHYARKNLGYLVAMRQGATTIIETDDDNIPYRSFWNCRLRRQIVPTVAAAGWVNIYRYFSDSGIWPRGLPLEHINEILPAFERLKVCDCECPIQQGLCNKDPDVDAVYRLTRPLPQSFRKDRRLALMAGSWCPFNSQNTTWWDDAFPLMYLPATCSFRMTDVWRGFIAQRIAWTNKWEILFHEPTVWQKRNEHDLTRDFRDEVPGYLQNSAICEALESLQLQSGTKHIGENLRACYRRLVRMKIFERRELELVDAWIDDLKEMPD